jgi:threonine dehydrogenase-like Zn-dependent dehydrogenase
MKALCWHGKKDVRVENVPDPKILNPGDAILKISSTAICGSDIHLFNGVIPTLKKGDILGHEFMGEVVETGPKVNRLKKGDRVVVPFTISCGCCHYCSQDMWSLCDNTNPNAHLAEEMNGYSTAGLFGFSHLYGGYAGGQAEFVRVPYANFGPLKIESDLSDEKVLFLSDIFPTGYMAAENCDIKPGQTVAVWGCGPVGQFAIRSAYLLGAHKVIAIDREPERLMLAAEGGAVVVNSEDDVLNILKELTGGRGPDACIDAVGMEAHGSNYDNVKQKLKLETDRPFALRQAIRACRKGGTISVPGVYAAFLDKFPFGIAFAKGISFKSGQTHVQKYMPKLLKLIEEGKIDPSFVITHRVPLDDTAKMYKIFTQKKKGCIKVVLKPGMTKSELKSDRGRGSIRNRDEPRSKRLREEETVGAGAQSNP